MSKLRQKLTYSNVIASLALFIALSGVAVAATALPRNSVGANQLKQGAVTAAKLRKGAVTAGKLAPKSVVAGKLGANSVTPGNLGNGVVSSAKLAEGAVLAKNIKNGVVTANKLETEAVTTAKLGKESITTAKLGPEVAPLLGTLRSGQTLRGVFDAGAFAVGAGDLSREGVSFQFPLAGNPPTVTVLKKGETTANCAGIGSGSAPAATGGNLCIYLVEEENLDSVEPLKADYNTRLGFGLAAKAAATGSFAGRGFWALTAP
ncbi:MAG TPA: hypothetical protein VMT37_08605 [Solirubrobacterales bacterium]|nr:hypothetical protein [Solirubrobacterales bacterium]